MKKLMILAAVVMLAAITQAATVTWTALNVCAGTGNTSDKANGIAYFIVSDTTPTSAWITGLTVDQCKDLVGTSYSYTPTSAGMYSMISGSNVQNSDLGLADSTSYKAYLIIFDGKTIDESTSFFVSVEKPGKTVSGTSNSNLTFGNLQTASNDAANWTAMAPEPTSGLLLLLGMGALALRRKRA